MLNDTYMSGEHARLTLHEGRWWIADLGSTNGTFVNGTRVDRPTPLPPDAEVRFGRVRMRFVS
jgi:pSer/pThr/pTyr-binding forkhead associated (FHA) protein